jgi:hypothetical protein
MISFRVIQYIFTHCSLRRWPGKSLNMWQLHSTQEFMWTQLMVHKGKSQVFTYLKFHRVFCFLVRSFTVLCHKEHIIFHIKYEIRISVWKYKVIKLNSFVKFFHYRFELSTPKIRCDDVNNHAEMVVSSRDSSTFTQGTVNQACSNFGLHVATTPKICMKIHK